MKKLLFLVTALLAIVQQSSAETKPVITVADVEARPGETVELSLNLANGKVNQYKSLQFDAQFPTTGFTIETDGCSVASDKWPEVLCVEGDINVDANGLATLPFASSEAISAADVDNLVTVKVKIDENVEDGEYTVTLKNLWFGYNNSDKDYVANDVVSKIIVRNYIDGDISGDGIVDVSDYTGIANYIHGKTPTGFDVKAADVNDDNVIDVSDYTGIANIIHTGSVHGTNHAMKVLSSNNSPLEVTDVSNINNVIYITPFSAAAGSEEYSVSINMKNVAAIRGFQFDLYLPEGVTAVKSAKGRIQGALSAGRLPEEDGHELTLSEQPDGAIRFLCSSQYEETFTGNDGEIATLKVNVDPDMPTGEYAVVLKDVKLTENDISIFYLTDQVNTTMTVTEATDGRILLDELSTSVPTAATNVNVRVKRTINANEWSTICLPFDMTEEQVKTVFGDDVQLKEFMEYEVSDGGKQISVTFDNALLAQDGFMANHPYIIKVSSKIEEFTVDGVTIDPDEDNAVAEYDNGKTGSRRQVYGTFKGTYHAGTTVPNNCLFLSGNKFWYSTGSTNMKAFRGYFDFKDVLEDADGARIGMSFNDETTGIGYNKRETITNNQWYTLDGRKLGKKPAEKGLYIVNNKKVVVR